MTSRPRSSYLDKTVIGILDRRLLRDLTSDTAIAQLLGRRIYHVVASTGKKIVGRGPGYIARENNTEFDKRGLGRGRYR